MSKRTKQQIEQILVHWFTLVPKEERWSLTTVNGKYPLLNSFYSTLCRVLCRKNLTNNLRSLILMLPYLSRTYGTAISVML